MLIDTGKANYQTADDFNYRAALIENGNTDLFVQDAKLTGNSAFSYWAVFAEALPAVARRVGYSVLDFGCGYGRCVNFLTMFDCARYVGVEPQDARLKYVMGRFAGFGRTFLPTIEVVPPDDRFDVIWSCTVLQHMLRPQKLATIREFVKRLKPGGIVILAEGEFREATEAECEARYASEEVGLHPCMIPVPMSEVREAFAPLQVWGMSKDAWGLPAEGGSLMFAAEIRP